MTNEMNTNEISNKNEFLLTYTPAKHDGIENWRGTEFTYHVETAANIEGEYFYASDLEADNKLKRFNSNRINEIISLTE